MSNPIILVTIIITHIHSKPKSASSYSRQTQQIRIINHNQHD
jgi:hypothetical protein